MTHVTSIKPERRGERAELKGLTGNEELAEQFRAGSSHILREAYDRYGRAVHHLDPDTSQMVSVGVLRDGGDELLPLPSTIDLRRYRLVDVSAEDYDGEVTHSGNSLLRGTLAG